MRSVRWIGLVGLGLLVAVACSSDDENGGGAGNGGAGAVAGDASAATGGTSASGGIGATGGSGAISGGSGIGATAGVGGTPGDGGCVPVLCQGHQYACGDCIDNDGDGKIDMADPYCLGPCHDTEEAFHPCIPGLNNAPCKLDCYYDQDSGAGNDQCYWDHHCDPLSKAPDYPPQGSACAYDPDTAISGTTQSCAELYDKQPDMCATICGPLTPNGCDCFGCCELPAESGNFVWLGSTLDDSLKCDKSSCKLGSEYDTALCKPCTPVAGCLNECDHCELCLGKTEIPADCYDGGTPDAGCPPPPVCNGGTPCDPNQPPECIAPCPVGMFCLTGCCTPPS